ncbi:hypothetical protein Tco_0328337 [Tanacetum coccineum]
MIFGIEESHHGPSDAMHNPPYPLKNICVILHSIHSDDGNPTSTNIKQALRQGLYQDYQDKDCQRRLLESFQDDIKYEHVGLKTQDHKKAKYYKDDQVMMKDLKGNVKRQRQRQRKGQDQDHKSMIGTKGASLTITQTRLKNKKHQ